MRRHWSSSPSIECAFQLVQGNKEIIHETDDFGSFLLQFSLTTLYKVWFAAKSSISNREIVNIWGMLKCSWRIITYSYHNWTWIINYLSVLCLKHLRVTRQQWSTLVHWHPENAKNAQIHKSSNQLFVEWQTSRSPIPRGRFRWEDLGLLSLVLSKGSSCYPFFHTCITEVHIRTLDHCNCARQRNSYKPTSHYVMCYMQMTLCIATFHTGDQKFHSLLILSRGECFTSPVFTCKLTYKSRNIWVHLQYVLDGKFCYHLVGIDNKHWRKYLNPLLLKHIYFHLRTERVVWSP
jgi:hypothetical protein